MPWSPINPLIRKGTSWLGLQGGIQQQVGSSSALVQVRSVAMWQPCRGRGEKGRINPPGDVGSGGSERGRQFIGCRRVNKKAGCDTTIELGASFGCSLRCRMVLYKYAKLEFLNDNLYLNDQLVYWSAFKLCRVMLRLHERKETLILYLVFGQNMAFSS